MEKSIPNFCVIKNQGSSPNFAFNKKANLSELVNFYSPWNNQKTYGFLMISEGIEVNMFKFA